MTFLSACFLVIPAEAGHLIPKAFGTRRESSHSSHLMFFNFFKKELIFYFSSSDLKKYKKRKIQKKLDKHLKWWYK